jgi:serpin B
MSLRVPSLVLVAVLASATASAAPPARPAPLPRGFVDANTAFALDLYARLRQQPGSLFFSPTSVSTALALTWAGARGETAAQMKRTLRFGLPPKQLHAAFGALLGRLQAAGDGGPELAIANRLWLQTGTPIVLDYQRLARDAYAAAPELVNFANATEAARRTINQAVAQATRGRIQELLPPGSVDALVQLVLTAAIYFKGQWEHEFPQTATNPQAFTVAPGVERRVPMMHNAKLQTRYGETNDLQVLELPYRAATKDRRLAMVVLLPTKVDGLGALEAALTPKSLAAALGALKPTKKVRVSLPRFTARTALSLGDTLAAMGMPLAFDKGRADFKGLSPRNDLYVTRLLHQAFVDVNETGTEAAAATAVAMGTKNGDRSPIFRADHPFLFLIRDAQTGSVLFIGRLVDPAESAAPPAGKPAAPAPRPRS